MVRVYECGCKDLGEDGRLYVVLLGRVFSAVMAQDCVGVVELSAAGVQRWVQGLQIVWGGLRTVVCTCAHRVHSAGQAPGDTDSETDGFCCQCGGPGLLRAQEGQSTRG